MFISITITLKKSPFSRGSRWRGESARKDSFAAAARAASVLEEDVNIGGAEAVVDSLGARWYVWSCMEAVHRLEAFCEGICS